MAKIINFDAVADLYDHYIKSDHDIPFFINEAKNTKGNILELMCGTGRVSIPLLEQGQKLTCVDKSSAMLKVFRKKLENKNHTVNINEMEVSELKLDEKFPLIIIPFHSFSEIPTEEKQLQALNNIRNHLEEGGKFICTLQNPKVRLITVDGQIRMLGKYPLHKNNHSMIISFVNNYYKETNTVNGFQFYEIYNEKNRLISKRHLEINFTLLEKETFEEMYQKADFKCDEFYGDYSYSKFDEDTSPFMIWKLS